MLPVPAIALSGMNAASAHLRTAAHNIANLGTTGFRRQQAVVSAEPSGVAVQGVVQSPFVGNSLETDMVGMMQAKHAFLANLAVFRAHDEIAGTLLDTFA